MIYPQQFFTRIIVEKQPRAVTMEATWRKAFLRWEQATNDFAFAVPLPVPMNIWRSHIFSDLFPHRASRALTKLVQIWLQAFERLIDHQARGFEQPQRIGLCFIRETHIVGEDLDSTACGTASRRAALKRRR